MKNIIGRIIDSELPEIKMDWDERQTVHIYLAGPDFPRYDTSLFDEIEQSLKNYNLVPHRPIKENGLYTGNETDAERQAMYEKDVELLVKCDFMIAILIDDDPGTFVEIGWMNHAEKPIVLFDPYKKAQNLFLVRSVDCIVYSVDELFLEVCNLLNRFKE